MVVVVGGWWLVVGGVITVDEDEDGYALRSRVQSLRCTATAAWPVDVSSHEKWKCCSNLRWPHPAQWQGCARGSCKTLRPMRGAMICVALPYDTVIREIQYQYQTRSRLYGKALRRGDDTPARNAVDAVRCPVSLYKKSGRSVPRKRSRMRLHQPPALPRQQM